MIKVDETDPVGEVQLSFPYRDVQIKHGIDPKDEYDLQEEIGRGKFGTVYKCKEKTSGLLLAAKFIGCPKKEDRRNVEREIDIMKSLQHPRLIQLYDAFENGKVMTVILELIEGGELFERVIDDDFILTEKACTIFMRQICEGVDFIHKQRILHLDMKPENILCLTKSGNRIKIIDLGLARRFDPDKKLQVLFGTPEFVAPEVVNFDDIGYGTDMWSVGVICYVLLSGLSPFMGATDVETMANVTIAKYDFDDEAFEEISDTAKDFIKKLLLKDMNQRLTAEDCLNHEWLKKKEKPIVVQRTPSMEVTKDNLRQFVERWNEHPNSPYVFEINNHIITSSNFDGTIERSNSSHSLVCESPSPCESLASSPGSDAPIHQFDNGFLSTESGLEPFRRSSDSYCFVKNNDIAERINLAEEIRKLSDKLYQLSNISTSIMNSENPFESKPEETAKEPKPIPDTKETIEFKPMETKTYKVETKIENHSKFVPITVLPQDHPKNPYCSVPWRRPKYKLNAKSRDVPLAVKSLNNPYQETFPKSSLPKAKMNGYQNRFDSENANDTKDLLLQLLEHWNGSRTISRSSTRHSSISADWTEQESLGQRSMSSLNSFFQSRAANKKITPFHFNTK